MVNPSSTCLGGGTIEIKSYITKTNVFELSYIFNYLCNIVPKSSITCIYNGTEKEYLGCLLIDGINFKNKIHLGVRRLFLGCPPISLWSPGPLLWGWCSSFDASENAAHMPKH